MHCKDIVLDLFAFSGTVLLYNGVLSDRSARIVRALAWEHICFRITFKKKKGGREKTLVDILTKLFFSRCNRKMAKAVIYILHIFHLWILCICKLIHLESINLAHYD